jgi:hypothetical protein
MSFENLKKKSSQSSIEALTKKVQDMNKGAESYKDDRFWTLTRDKSGNGYAVIRFLPAVEGEDVPFVRTFSHSFQGPDGSWYIENCPTTLGGKCPACEANSELWNSGIDANKKIASGRKRKLSYTSNILVIKDSANPDNEGKVFLYKYGKKIFDKISECMTPNPQFEDEKPCDPFDLWTGRNFKLKAKMVEGYPNYDSSSFDAASPVGTTDEYREAIWKKEYKLVEFTQPDKFKPYDVLSARLTAVLSGRGKNASTEDSKPALTEQKAAPAATKAAKPAATKAATPAPFEATGDGDDALAMLQKLAEGDEA